MGTREMGIDAAFAWPSGQIRLADPGSLEGKDSLEKEFAEPYCSAGHLAVDDIIDPRETRPILVNTLIRLAKKQSPVRSWKKHGLIAL